MNTNNHQHADAQRSSVPSEEADSIARDVLRRHGFGEAHRIVAEYTAYRIRSEVGLQRVFVRLLDAGADHPNARFRCEVLVEEGELRRELWANAAPTIEEAMMTPHWFMLDAD
ncbi:MAG: hypothetical protein HZA52_13090 [Planctomycetes bacterium]|nr:hypothetical protein [Planctomycetota bacterium]